MCRNLKQQLVSENVVDTKPVVAEEERRKLKLQNQRQKGETLKPGKREIKEVSNLIHQHFIQNHMNMMFY